MTELIQILTTTPDKLAADRIARALVEARLAACVQIVGPVESVYRWEGAIESAVEWQCLVKTTAARFDEVAAAIRNLHSYSVPEILALPVVAGNSDYVAWVKESVTTPARATESGL